MEIHIARDNVKYGPYDPETLRELHANGQVVDTDLAWHHGLDRWVYVAELDPSVLPREAPATPVEPSAAVPATGGGRPVLVTGAAADAVTATRRLAQPASHHHPATDTGHAGTPAMTAAQRAATLRLGTHGGALGGRLSVTDVLFGFNGRLSLGAYWGYTVGILGILFVVFVAVALVVGPDLVEMVPTPADPAGMEALDEATAEPVALPPLGAAAVGILIVFGILYLLALFCSLALQVKRWHDRDKSGWWVLIAFVPVVGAIWAFVECYCLPGTPGPNRFGPDPRQLR